MHTWEDDTCCQALAYCFIVSRSDFRSFTTSTLTLARRVVRRWPCGRWGGIAGYAGPVHLVAVRVVPAAEPCVEVTARLCWLKQEAMYAVRKAPTLELKGAQLRGDDRGKRFYSYGAWTTRLSGSCYEHWSCRLDVRQVETATRKRHELVFIDLPLRGKEIGAKDTVCHTRAVGKT